MIETVRLGNRAKNQLVTLKRKTGIQNWNVLCRWAFVSSIRESSRPRQVAESADGGVEMTWRTFGGEFSDVYEGLLKYRCLQDGDEATPQALSKHLRRHIYRGLGYLTTSNSITNVADLAALTVESEPSP